MDFLSWILQNQYTTYLRVTARYEVIHPCDQDIALDTRKTDNNCFPQNTLNDTNPIKSVWLLLNVKVHTDNTEKKNVDLQCGIHWNSLHSYPVIRQDNS